MGKVSHIVKTVFKYFFLACYVAAGAVILAESAVEGTESAAQSNSVTSIFNDSLDDDYDEENIIDIKDFDVTFSTGDKTSFYPGETTTFTIGYTPSNTSFKSIDIDYDEDCLSIDSDYTITFLNVVESTDITFTSSRYTNLEKTYTFSIVEKDVESVTITDSPTENLNINDTYQLQIKVLPEDATNKNVKYSSSNSSVASVTSAGLVKAISAGTATITVTSSSNPDLYDTCTITVNAKEETVKEVESISLNKSSLSMYAGESGSLSVSVSPPDATNYNASYLTISNYDASYLTISKPGRTITVKSSSSKNETYDIKGITVNYDDGNIDVTCTFDVHVTAKQYLSIDDVNQSGTTFSYHPIIYNNMTYGQYSISSFTIKVAYKVSGSGYITTNTQWSYDTSALTKVSSSYNSITLRLKDATDSANYAGSVLYYPDKSDTSSSLTFTYQYTVEEDTQVIQSVESSKFYTYTTSKTEGENNVLFLGEEYTRIFSEDYLTPSSFENTGIYYSLISGDDVIAILDSSGEDVSSGSESAYSIQTLSTGTAVIEMQSVFEMNNATFNSKSSAEVTHCYVEIEVTDIPTSSYLYEFEDNGDESKLPEGYEPHLEKEGSEHIGMKFEFEQKYKGSVAETYTGLVYDYEVTSDNDNVYYNPDNKMFSAYSTGETTFTFSASRDDIDLSNTITIIIDYVPVYESDFSLSFSLVHAPEYNEPSDDYSTVAVGSRFYCEASVNDDATNKEVIYSSTGEDVLTIDWQTGYCTALATGTADIVCYSADNPETCVTKTITVCDTVAPFTIDYDTFTPESHSTKTTESGVEYEDVTILYGKTYVIKITPEYNCSCSSLTFEYMNPDGKEDDSVISVDMNGNLQSMSTGEIWLKITYGGDTTLHSYVQYLKITVQRDTADAFRTLANFIRKSLGHFGLFFAFAGASALFILFQCKKYSQRMIASGVSMYLGFTFAGMSELIQYYTEGRSGNWKDIGIDTGGYAACIVIAIVIFTIIFIVKWYRSKNLKSVRTEGLSDSDGNISENENGTFPSGGLDSDPEEDKAEESDGNSPSRKS